jgi:hypothetical protein
MNSAFAAIRPWIIAEAAVLVALVLAYAATGSNIWLFGMAGAAFAFGTITALVLVTHKRKTTESADAP